MKKHALLSMLAALIVLLLLCCSAGAETTVKVSEALKCAPGEIRVPVYPDLSAQIGQGLTQEDFVITYSSSSPYVTVAENGQLAISAQAPLYSNLPLTVTYTPKTAGVGETTHFEFTLRTTKPLTGMTASQDAFYMAPGPWRLVDINLEGGVDMGLIADISYDSSVIALERTDYNASLTTLRFSGIAVGETNIVVTAYNGMKVSVHVVIPPEPTKVEFAAERFTCYVGDTVDLGLDTGNGPYGLKAYPPNTYVYRDGQSVWAADYFPEGRSLFYAKEAGSFQVQVDANTHSGRTQIDVYDRANCASIALSTGVLYQNQANIRVFTYDENGALVVLPMRITQGADIARLTGQTILATGEGTVEITVDNADGTTTSQNFIVPAQPEEVRLNVSELTLDIGDTFDVAVSFDKGSAFYSLNLDYDDYSPAFGLFPAALVGEQLIAYAPGTATLTVTAGELQATCSITVRDSDQAVSLVIPEGPFGVGDSFRLKVKDRTGKSYPAIFSRDGSAVSITSDGLMTGVSTGTSAITAVLEDGRVLKYKQTVEMIPHTLSHPDLSVPENYTTVGLGPISTDVGTIYGHEVTVAIADESIATFDGSYFTFHKAGRTTVTLTAIKGGAQTTFTLTVLPADDSLYVQADGKLHASGYYSMSVPSGYSEPLPTVTDYYGSKVSVTWKITSQVSGAGNPNSTAFALSGGKISCSWPSGHCTLTGTAQNGSTIEVSVIAFDLSKEICFRADSYTVEVGKHVQTEVSSVDHADLPGKITWTVGDAQIIAFDENFPQTGMPTVTGLKPGTTTLTATLINGVSASCTITVTGSIRVPGDANDDGGVHLDDAMAILRHAAGENVSINASNADVNADGQVDIQDALVLLQYSAGWNVTLK